MGRVANMDVMERLRERYTLAKAIQKRGDTVIGQTALYCKRAP